MNPILAFYPMGSVLAQAAAIQAILAGSSARLFKSGFTPAFNSPLSDFVANEADYSGYPGGGVTIPAFFNPTLAPNQGASIMAPTVQFARDGTQPGVNNLIGGWFLTTAGGVVWACGTFPQSIPFSVPGIGTPLVLNFGFPGG